MKSLNGKSRRVAVVLATTAVMTYAGIGFAGGPKAVPSHATASAVATVFATGLVNPRGLKFGPDGKLYVAEGGFPVPPTIGAPPGLGGRRWTRRIFWQCDRLSHLENRRPWSR